MSAHRLILHSQMRAEKGINRFIYFWLECVGFFFVICIAKCLCVRVEWAKDAQHQAQLKKNPN